MIMLSGRNPTKQKKLHHVKEIATRDELETKEITYSWTSNSTSWGMLGQTGASWASWGKLGQVGNQRNYRILTLKKTSWEEEEERKKEEEYRI